MSNNKFDINNFILTDNDKIIIENIKNKPCFYEKSFISYYSINGFTDTISKIDYTYLIPNLFRLCYLQTSITIPDVCLLYNNNDVVFNNFPLILDEIYCGGGRSGKYTCFNACKINLSCTIL